MLKKAVLSSPYQSGLQCCISNHSSQINTSPLALPPQRARPGSLRQSAGQWRAYANVKRNNAPDFRDNTSWPCRKGQDFPPTPYEIFELEKGAMYSKHKYYELVKIYHPDRHVYGATYSETITQGEKLERYRLIVQAHEILSDPEKRRAYDSYGAGWGTRTVTRHSRGYSSSAGDGRVYGFGPGDDSSPFANATWEDWERWYRRNDNRDKQAYAGTYVNPNMFASFVILLAVLSGVAQATRAGQYSGSLEEKANTFTEETSRFLTSRAEHYSENRMSSDERVRHFLERRDPTRYGLKDDEEEFYRKHFGKQHQSPPNVVPKVEKPD